MAKVTGKLQTKRFGHPNEAMTVVTAPIPISDKATKRVIAPYVRIVRKGIKPVETEEAKQFQTHLQKKPSVLIRDLSSFLSDSVDLRSLLHETSEVLKAVTKATGVTLYMMDSATQEIFVSRKIPVAERYKIRWKIQEGTTVASYVAYKKEYVLVDDILRDDRFPEGIGYEGETIKSILCVPVVTPDGECFAVIELYKLLFDKSFTNDDLKIAIVVTGWMGAAIHQNSQRLALQRQLELNDYLLDLTKCYIGETVYMEKLIQEIVKFAKVTLAAERGSFFVIDRECDELVADLFDDYEGEDFKKSRVRFGKERGIAGLVARTGVTVNVKDAYNDARFNKEIDQKSGFITRSILCMPILGTEGVLGVLQVVNKRNGGFFTHTDEMLFRTFSAYSALALHYTNVNKQVTCTKHLNNCFLKMIQLQKVPCLHDMDDLIYNQNIQVPLNFYKYWCCQFLHPKAFILNCSFNWYVNPEDHHKLPHFCFFIMKNIMNRSELNLENTMKFILTTRKLCRKNPFHNFEHAFSVFHCMYLILRRNITKFNHIEIKALLVAALCHDVDHPGFTNSFLELANDDLCYLYDDFLLQNHQYYVTTLILQECKIFNYLSKEEEKQFNNEVREAILAAEASSFIEDRLKLMQLCHSGSFDWNDDLHKRYLKGVMMMSCDLSNQCKPFLIAKRNTDNLYIEYYKQGDFEKKMGLCCLSHMDRKQQNRVPEDQILFLTVIVLPCVDLLRTLLPNTESLYTEASLLRQTWQDIINVRGKKCWRQDDTIVQKNVIPI